MHIISPLDQAPLGQYTATPAAEIHSKLAAARQAAGEWAQIPVQTRAAKVAALNRLLSKNTDRICQTLGLCGGKVPCDALLGDLFPLMAQLEYYRKHAKNILAPKRVFTSPLMFPDAAAAMERKPFGVAAVISPWNYPLQLTLTPIITALIAGNGVIYKTSELSAPVGDLITELLAELQLPPGLTQQITGGRETGQAMIDAGPDMVFFTGGLAAGRAIMQRAAQHPIPALLELGGKDAMLVLEDADLQRACNAALYGAFNNSGQVCVGIERLYAHRDCHDALLAKLLDGVAKLKVAPDQDVGALGNPAQWAIIEEHYADAVAQGAQTSGPLQRDGLFVKPVVLWNVHHGMKIMREESFGPLLPIMAFADADEAVRLANDSAFGLNASVWSRNIPAAERLARQLQVGNWAVNDVVRNIGHPGLGFGGVKHSGFGRYHGAEGLLAFSYPVSSLTSRSRSEVEANWFPYGAERYAQLRGFLDFMYGEGPIKQRFLRNRVALQSFRRYSGIYPRQIWHNLRALLPKRVY